MVSHLTCHEDTGLDSFTRHKNCSISSIFVTNWEWETRQYLFNVVFGGIFRNPFFSLLNTPAHFIALASCLGHVRTSPYWTILLHKVWLTILFLELQPFVKKNLASDAKVGARTPLDSGHFGPIQGIIFLLHLFKCRDKNKQIRWISDPTCQEDTILNSSRTTCVLWICSFQPRPPSLLLKKFPNSNLLSTPY